MEVVIDPVADPAADSDAGRKAAGNAVMLSTAEHSSLRSEPARIWSESGPKPGRIRPGSHWQAGPVLTGRQVLDSWSEAQATRSRPSIGCNARVNAS